jgi:hypothetical protein
LVSGRQGDLYLLAQLELCTFAVAVRGNSSAHTTSLGALNLAGRPRPCSMISET